MLQGLLLKTDAFLFHYLCLNLDCTTANIPRHHTNTSRDHSIVIIIIIILIIIVNYYSNLLYVVYYCVY